ncbi:MAG TPA: MgtC/SapB family protein [Vicinamibacterales bacterium]|nr:MgtC/SapB family protein [Vicinamibacterales bacterium]
MKPGTRVASVPAEVVVEQLGESFDTLELSRVALRLGVAAVLGALIGIEREWMRKAAGLRTHTTVALASATFVMIINEGDAASDGISRVIQGITAGIGFLGAGTILKGNSAETISGLTTAATIWLTAAIGAAAGAGHVDVAVLSVIAALVTLSLFTLVERMIGTARD